MIKEHAALLPEWQFCSMLFSFMPGGICQPPVNPCAARLCFCGKVSLQGFRTDPTASVRSAPLSELPVLFRRGISC